ALLRTLRPESLEIPPRIVQLFPPRSYGHDRTRESLPSRTTPAFDALSAPEALANHVVSLLLEPSRAARLIEYRARDRDQLGLGDVLDGLVEATWKAPAEEGFRAEIRRVVGQVVLYHLMALAANDRAPGQARALALATLNDLAI